MNIIRTLAGLVVAGVLAAASPLPQIHPDCVASQAPVLCTVTVNQIIQELNYFNQVFSIPGAQGAAQAALFYHPDAVLYTKATDSFYVGRQAIQNTYFAPLFSTIRGAKVDVSALHFAVIDFDSVVVYGRPGATITLPDGTVLNAPPLPQTLTFVRNPQYDPKRPFVMMQDQE